MHVTVFFWVNDFSAKKRHRKTIALPRILKYINLFYVDNNIKSDTKLCAS